MGDAGNMTAMRCAGENLQTALQTRAGQEVLWLARIQSWLVERYGDMTNARTALPQVPRADRSLWLWRDGDGNRSAAIAVVGVVGAGHWNRDAGFAGDAVEAGAEGGFEDVSH